MPSATSPDLRSPWREFLAEVDRRLPGPVQLHCLGGFVVAVRYRFPRPTGDVDYIEIIPHDALEGLERIAGRESQLAKKHHLYFQHVVVASLPESYVERLTELFSDHFEKLQLFAVEAHDLALSKLVRNSPVDREARRQAGGQPVAPPPGRSARRACRRSRRRPPGASERPEHLRAGHERSTAGRRGRCRCRPRARRHEPPRRACRRGPGHGHHDLPRRLRPPKLGPDISFARTGRPPDRRASGRRPAGSGGAGRGSPEERSRGGSPPIPSRANRRPAHGPRGRVAQGPGAPALRATDRPSGARRRGVGSDQNGRLDPGERHGQRMGTPSLGLAARTELRRQRRGGARLWSRRLDRRGPRASRLRTAVHRPPVGRRSAVRSRRPLYPHAPSAAAPHRHVQQPLVLQRRGAPGGRGCGAGRAGGEQGHRDPDRRPRPRLCENRSGFWYLRRRSRRGPRDALTRSEARASGCQGRASAGADRRGDPAPMSVTTIDRTALRARLTELGVLLALSVPFLFVELGMPLLDPHEALYATIAPEILNRQDWVIPHINGLPYL